MTDLSARIAISANDQASSVLMSIGGNIKKVFENLPGPARAAAGGIAAIGLASIAVAVKSTQMAADYQQSMLKVESLAGYTKDQANQASQAILDMAGQVGKSPKELADALFYVASAGFKGAQSLSILRLSAMAAATGGSTVKDVADGLTSALNAFGISGDKAGTVMDMITKTVASGKMQMTDYVAVVGKLSTVSKASGVGFDEMNAALATMTNSGYSAQYGSTLLSNLFTTLDLKTDALAKHAKGLGISFDEQKFKSMSLAEQIKFLDQATNGNSSTMLKLLGNNATALKTYEALKNNLGSYNSTLNTVKNSQGASAQAFAKAQEGFNQQMAQAKASVDALMIRIGSALLPVLTQLMSKVGPLISQFTQWLTTHHVLENAATGLGNAIKVVATIIGGLATGIANIVNFFRQNQMAADALKATFAGLAIGLAVWLATLLPGMIAGFITWAVTAGAAAISTLLLAAPFILIGVIAAVVILGIILLFRNWGAISAWLRGVWSAFSGWFMGLLSGIGQFFVGIWHGMQAGLAAAWAFIVNIVKIGARLLFLAIFGPIIAIIALFQFLYNHNYYFKALVDSIVNFFKACFAWLQGAWSTAIGFLGGLWSGLLSLGARIWSMITGAIQVAVQTAWNFLVSIWTMASSWLSAQWNKYYQMAVTAWQAVSRVFSSIWSTYIAGPLNSLTSQITGFWSNLASQAVSWGQNLIQGLINGIKNMAGQAGQAAQDIAHNIASFLGFHSPAERGPGAELDVWGPNLIKGFSQGMIKALPVLDAAVNVTAKRLTPLSSQNSSDVRAPGGVAATGGGTVINLVINVPSRTRNEADEIAKVVMDKLSRELRRSGNLVTVTSGGRT